MRFLTIWKAILAIIAPTTITMHAVHKSSDIGRHIELDTTCERPDGVPTGLPKGVFDR